MLTPRWMCFPLHGFRGAHAGIIAQRAGLRKQIYCKLFQWQERIHYDLLSVMETWLDPLVELDAR